MCISSVKNSLLFSVQSKAFYCEFTSQLCDYFWWTIYTQTCLFYKLMSKIWLYVCRKPIILALHVVIYFNFGNTSLARLMAPCSHSVKPVKTFIRITQS